MSNNRNAFAVVATLSLFSALADVACRPAEASPAQPESEVSFDVGTQSWHATTRAPVPSGNRLAWISIEESVRLDPTGRLVHAETRAHDQGGSPDVHVTFDVPSHSVTVEQAGKVSSWTVPGNEPWILGPVTGPQGEVVPTPLVAWTTYRATKESEWVRLVTQTPHTSYVVPRDQYVVGTTVVVGDQAIEVDEQFVRSIKIGGVELARGGAHGSAFSFHGG